MIIFLYGEDTFRSRRKLNELREKFLREIDKTGASLSLIDGEKAAIGEINGAIAPLSLLAKKRMIVIENIFSNKSKTIFKELNEYFNSKRSDENIVIFWDGKIDEKKLSAEKNKLFKLLNKSKLVQNFKSLSNTEIINWTKKEIEERGGKISREALYILTSLASGDLWQIDNDITKLLNYKTGQQLKLGKSESTEITDEDVKNLVSGQVNENIFALTDALASKNKKMAAKLLEDHLAAGLTEGYLLNMIIRQFKTLLQIRQAIDSGFTSRKIITLLKIHPYVAQKGIGQVRNFSLDQLKKILSELIKIDYLMKSGQVDAITSISLLIVKI